jgi:murein DD-endopeptidase MepM/ murein hydrolase activator NlpD
MVVALEKAIMGNGFTLPGGSTGVFDKRLLTVLKTFQRVVGLRVTGVVDAPTAKVLKLSAAPATTSAPSAPTYPLTPTTLPAPGSRGNTVVHVQRALISRGFKILGGADGIYGSATRAAVSRFQSSKKLSVTGRVDVATARALGLVAPAPAPTKPALPSTIPWNALPVIGQRGDAVKVLQNALIAAKIPLVGGADGIFGTATANAIRAFQAAKKLDVNGRLDLRTAIALGITKGPSVVLDVFPVQGRCSFSNTWQAPRSNGRVHEGVDIIAPLNNLVYAVKDGTITRLYSEATDRLAGNGVRLTTDDGTYFFYAHFSRIATGIRVGTKVKAGQVIGYIGSTGASSGPHLHFEVHPLGGAAVDPTPYVAAVNACHVTAPRPQP